MFAGSAQPSFHRSLGSCGFGSWKVKNRPILSGDMKKDQILKHNVTYMGDIQDIWGKEVMLI